MGNRTTKSSLRNAIIHLNISAQDVDLNDEKFWDQIWQEDQNVASEVIRSIRTEEIRMLRDGSSENFAALAFKMVERLHISTGTLCNTHSQQTAVLNAVKILIRLIPCTFEDENWYRFFIDNNLPQPNEASPSLGDLRFLRKKSIDRDYICYLPQDSRPTPSSPWPSSASRELSRQKSLNHENRSPDLLLDIQDQDDATSRPQNSVSQSTPCGDRSLIRVLVNAICDLLFCPELTVTSKSAGHMSSMIDAPPEDLRSLASFEYVWEPGVGYESTANSTTYYDKTRSELLRLFIACCSEFLYQSSDETLVSRNLWIELFTSKGNRHTLPLFTSLLNTVLGFNPSRISLTQLVFEDIREELVGLSSQVLISVIDYGFKNSHETNMFIDYLSRIHRDEDFIFIIKGFSRLLNSGLYQGLLTTSRQFKFHYELLILFSQVCTINKKFVNFLMKFDHILDILVPILYHMNENYQETNQTAKIYLGAFNLLILSKERNFAVRLNRPYTTNLLTNLPTFKGSYGDLMIVVFHKLILYGENIYQLYDYLITIVNNVSPYLKNLTVLASKCLIQLFEIFSSPHVIFTEPRHHSLVIYLLETFNNLLQYQFDANINLTYVIILKKETFRALANLTSTPKGIQKVFAKLSKKKHLIKTPVELERSACCKDASSEISENIDIPVEDEWHSSCLLQGDDTSRNLVVALLEAPEICKVTEVAFPFQNDCATTILSSTSGKDVSKLYSPSRSSPDGRSDILTDESDDLLSIGIRAVRDSTKFPRQELVPNWKPTPEWIRSWKKSVPLHTTMRMIEVLAPQLDSMGFAEMNQSDQLDLTIKFLSNGTLVGLLPVPPPIVIRKYKTSEEALQWFTACTWAGIYVRNNIWIRTSVKLVKLL